MLSYLKRLSFIIDELMNMSRAHALLLRREHEVKRDHNY